MKENSMREWFLLLRCHGYKRNHLLQVSSGNVQKLSKYHETMNSIMTKTNNDNNNDFVTFPSATEDDIVFVSSSDQIFIHL
jgi:hypothetical protein